MEKLILCMLVAAITFIGCKKEPNLVNTNSPASTSMSSQKKPIVGIKQIPGAFVILNGDVDSGTCWPTNGICFTIVTMSKTMLDSTFTVVDYDFSEKYGEGETADLIINSNPNTTINGIKSIDLRYDAQGVGTFSYKR